SGNEFYNGYDVSYYLEYRPLLILGVSLRVGLYASSPRSVDSQFLSNLITSLWAFRFYPSRRLKPLTIYKKY
ncbi:MAG: hypothetical protein K0R51_2937, partial [Cytophagaceae bacterium]|nr:hypothetical protein [Cytophagaceae bacterium]